MILRGNSDKIILDLCGGTGAWSKPYREAGYDVRLITLPNYDVRTYEPPAGVYGILAAPPCTEFSLAKGGRPRDFRSGIEVASACLQIIWKCRIDDGLKFWALENPVGFMRQFLGHPHFTFEQWEFGDWHIKRTDLWGYFHEPRKTCSDRPPIINLEYPEGKSHSKCWSKRKCPPEYAEYLSRFSSDERRAAIRAITPPGFARAFFKANQ